MGYDSICKEHNIDRYNFTVLPETFSENAEDAGVQNLKKDLTLKFMNILVILSNQLNHYFIK